jgi:hypothetical protein
LRFKSSDDDGNKKLAYREHREEGVEEHCVGSDGPQRNVVLDKKKNKK